MNIYVLDDGLSLWPFVQDCLLTGLTGEGHHVASKQDAQALLEFLRTADEPVVALLGPALHGMANVEWVRRARALDSPVRPHLLVALDDDRVRKVMEAFQAGADDCVASPWQPDIFGARVMAAAQQAAHQKRLLDGLKQRDLVLSQMVSPLAGENKQEAAAKAVARAAAAAALAPVAAAKPVAAGKSHASAQDILAEVLPADAVEQLVAETLMSMGFCEAEPEMRENAPLAKPFSLVHFLVLPEKTLWLDLLLEADRESSLKLFEAFSGMDAAGASDADLMDALGETLNLVQAALKARFKSFKCDILTPIVPQSVPPEKVPAMSQQAVYSRKVYGLGEIQLRFTLFVHGRPATKKPLKALQLGDVLAEPLRPDEESDLVIINKGTQLVGRYLSKASDLADSTAEKHYQAVVEPSQLGLAVCKK